MLYHDGWGLMYSIRRYWAVSVWSPRVASYVSLRWRVERVLALVPVAAPPRLHPPGAVFPAPMSRMSRSDSPGVWAGGPNPHLHDLIPTHGGHICPGHRPQSTDSRHGRVALVGTLGRRSQVSVVLLTSCGPLGIRGQTRLRWDPLVRGGFESANNPRQGGKRRNRWVSTSRSLRRSGARWRHPRRSSIRPVADS